MEDVEDVERGGHEGYGGCRGQEGSNIHNIVISCNVEIMLYILYIAVTFNYH